MKKMPETLPAREDPLRAYTPRYVAEATSLHIETVRQALRTGRILGVRMGSHWRITHSTLAAMLRQGLPAKPATATRPPVLEISQ